MRAILSPTAYRHHGTGSVIAQKADEYYMVNNALWTKASARSWLRIWRICRRTDPPITLQICRLPNRRLPRSDVRSEASAQNCGHLTFIRWSFSRELERSRTGYTEWPH